LVYFCMREISIFCCQFHRFVRGIVLNFVIV